METINLSKSKLEIFKDCPRCFWLQERMDLKRPEGIRAGVPNALDRVFKAHYDVYRAKGVLPPELAHVPEFQGWRLYRDGDGPLTIKQMRYYKTGPGFQVGNVLVRGALDDALFNPSTGQTAMLDVKSKAKVTDEADTWKYYGTQFNVYDTALEVTGFKAAGFGAFIYLRPLDVGQYSMAAESLPMGWGVQPIVLKPADRDGVKNLAVEAGRCIESEKAPRHSATCEYCAFVQKRVDDGSYLKAADTAAGA